MERRDPVRWIEGFVVHAAGVRVEREVRREHEVKVSGLWITYLK